MGITFTAGLGALFVLLLKWARRAWTQGSPKLEPNNLGAMQTWTVWQ